jgi:hypothetical protein
VAPAEPPPAAPAAPSIDIHVDLSGLAAIWTSLSRWLYTMLRDLLVGIWNATLLPIPHETTDGFGLVQSLMPNPTAIAAAGITLAMALVGLQTILRATAFGHSAMIAFLTGRFLGWVFVLSALPWLISHAIDWQQNLAKSISVTTLQTILPEAINFNPIAFIVMVIFGVGLWLKLAANVIHIAVAVVWAPVGAVCGLIPGMGHIASLWAHEFFGRLAGALLATVASAIGLGLVTTGTGGDFAIFGAAAAFIAAGDMVDWFAKSRTTSVAGFTGSLLYAGGMAASAMGIGTGAGAAAASASAAASNAARVAASMPSYRYDYSYD